MLEFLKKILGFGKKVTPVAPEITDKPLETESTPPRQSGCNKPDLEW
jgi:hypothetical protein